MKPILIVIAGPTELARRPYVYDNSVQEVEARLFARYTDGQLRKTYGVLPAWVAAAVANAPKHPASEAIE